MDGSERYWEANGFDDIVEKGAVKEMSCQG